MGFFGIIKDTLIQNSFENKYRAYTNKKGNDYQNAEISNALNSYIRETTRLLFLAETNGRLSNLSLHINGENSVYSRIESIFSNIYQIKKIVPEKKFKQIMLCFGLARNLHNIINETTKKSGKYKLKYKKQQEKMREKLEILKSETARL